MPTTFKTAAFAITALLVLGAPGVWAETAGVLSKDSLSWRPAPASLPRGAEFASLYGDPTQGGPFVLRIRLPKGYKIGPHTHGALEMLTIISGELRYGMGRQFDPGAEKFAHAGDFIVTPAETGHWVVANDDTVLQLSSIGPFDIMYLDPRDDPRVAQR